MPMFDDVPWGTLLWRHVRPLLEAETQESELLDYKGYPDIRDFQRTGRERIVKTIAAMANTHGGDIILGVNETDEGKPDIAGGIRGVPGRDVRRITSAIEERMWEVRPPVPGVSVEPVKMPESRRAEGSPGTRLLVIRVPRSDSAPHFIPGIGHYGRVGTHNRRFTDEPLSTEWLQRLLNNRARSTQLREDMLRFIDGVKGAAAWHKVWCAPLYPWRSLWPGKDRSAIEGLMPRIAEPTEGPSPGGHALPRAFEHYLRVEPEEVCRSVQHGWLWQVAEQHPVGLPAYGLLQFTSQGPFATYLVDDRGVVALKGLTRTELCGTRRETKPYNVPYYFVAFDWAVVTAALLMVCEHAARLYEQSGYVGEVQFGLEVGIDPTAYSGPAHLGSRVVRPHEGRAVWKPGLTHLPASSPGMAAPGGLVQDSDTCLSRDIRRAVRDTEVHARWVRAFGFVPTPQGVKDVLEAVEDSMLEADTRGAR